MRAGSTRSRAMRLRSAAGRGAAFGMAAAAIETWSGTYQILAFNMQAPLRMMLSGAALSVALATVLGVLCAPIARGGWHIVAVAVLWGVLGVASAEGSRALQLFALAEATAALALTLGGVWLARRARWLPVGATGLAIVAGIALPEVLARRRAPAPVPTATSVAPPGAPDVFVVVLDTVRADHVSAYGYERPTTPVLDALAREGALFLDTTSPATWSLPSHASLFTGRFVSGHGAHDEHRFLRAEHPTLAGTLAAAGWDTRSFTANAWISDGLGLTRGFAWTDEAWRSGDVARNFHAMHRLLDRAGFGPRDKGGAHVAGNVEAWLAERPADARPAFVFVNFIEAHFPYHQLPAEFVARFTSMSRRQARALSLELTAAQFGAPLPDPSTTAPLATALYDAGVAYADHLLGRLIDALRRRGTLDRTIVVVLADHGELLGEHGAFGHGTSLYDAVLRVPLVVRYPPRVPAGVRVAQPVSAVGVFATVADLVGVPPPTSVQVGSLVPAIAGEAVRGPVLAEQYASMLGRDDARDHPLLRRDARFRAYRAGTTKVVISSHGPPHLFDLVADPDELHDRSEAEPARVQRLTAELGTWTGTLGLPALDAPVAAAAPAVDPAAQQRLRALGYVE